MHGCPPGQFTQTLARPLRGLIHRFAEELVAAGERSGAHVMDFSADPVGSDPRLWSDDRLHANSPGHARIAQALASASGLPLEPVILSD